MGGIGISAGIFFSLASLLYLLRSRDRPLSMDLLRRSGDLRRWRCLDSYDD